MPIVNGKEYAYTEEGIAAAEKAKKRSGFKMKYTNGKKASVAKMFANIVPMNPNNNPTNQEQDPIARKIDEKIEEKVNEVVNQQTNEGLV